ncbi:MAG: hypothetical protein Q8O87_00460 [bacterium]|nr:hypothetical protein [bacterium]
MRYKKQNDKRRKRQRKRQQKKFFNSAESAVVWVCEKWLNEGKILQYIHARPSGELDRRGVDVLIFLNSTAPVAVQITFKISDKQIKDKRDRHFKKYPFVPGFLVVENVPLNQHVAKNQVIYDKIEQDLIDIIAQLTYVPREDINKLKS